MASNVQSKLLLEAAQRYAQQISPEALVALSERGISEEVAALYMLGTVTDPMNGHELHDGWISIPYITALGSCVGFKFRRLDDGKPKYGSPTGQKAHLYNVTDTTILSRHIVVCEGELDTVIVSGVLGIPAVGVPGVQALLLDVITLDKLSVTLIHITSNARHYVINRWVYLSHS